MPIVTVHLLEGRYPTGQVSRLLAGLTERYAAVLESPPARIRAFAELHPPELWLTGGEPGRSAPYFTALVLAGRPVGQRHRLLAEFTDLIVDVLGVERAAVRGQIVPVDPDDWGIGGVPAGAARRSEIEARAAARSDG